MSENTSNQTTQPTPQHQRKLEQALAAIHDGDEALLAIARKQCRITTRTSGHGVRTVAPLPINLGAWQLSQDIDELILSIARARTADAGAGHRGSDLGDWPAVQHRTSVRT